MDFSLLLESGDDILDGFLDEDGDTADDDPEYVYILLFFAILKFADSFSPSLSLSLFLSLSVSCHKMDQVEKSEF